MQPDHSTDPPELFSDGPNSVPSPSVAELEAQLMKVSGEFARYRDDKELYVAALTGRLHRVRWAEKALDRLSIQRRRAARAQSLAKKGAETLRSDGVGATFGAYRQWKTMRGMAHISERFDPYHHVQILKPIKVESIQQTFNEMELLPPFSVITTVRNESASITGLLTSLMHQSAVPSQIVIVDGGSTDDTVALIRQFAAASLLSVEVIEAGPVNIAAGRNIALRRCAHEYVVLVDAGCKLTTGYCRALIGAFVAYPTADLVGGVYRSPHRPAARFIPDWTTVDWTRFLPSARSLAIRTSVAEAAGLFPEYLTKTGEDTWFDVMYRRRSTHWVYNREAMVEWAGPETVEEADALAYSYGYGDGESGFGDYTIDSSCLRNPESVTDPLIAGYLKGRNERPRIEFTNRQVLGSFLILSGVPFTDSGGGQRGTQLALALVRAGYRVTFVNVYPSFEEKQKFFFDVNLSLLEFASLDDFDVDQYIARYGTTGRELVVMLEFPHPRFIEVYQRIRANVGGSRVVFDYIDNWTSSLGWEWYSEETETAIMNDADILVASAKTLQQSMAKRVSKDVLLIPNAVNDTLFDPTLEAPRPDDIPTGKVVLYIGAMWGAWFDWAMVCHAAQHLPELRFVFVGTVPEERREEMTKQFANVSFLGLKPQSELPAYIKAANVCIIPFTTDHITEFVNPLKVYEYLAMGKPVVSADMPEVRSLPLVRTYASFDEAVRAIKDAVLEPTDCNVGAAVLSQHGWTARVQTLQAAIATSVQQL
jgi:glycosyltransferase involved in cell wall biosynthesis